jgi:thymidylate synthase (FAD)
MTFKAKLIAVTKGVVEGIDSAQELIAYCARVSNPSNQMNMDTAEKLLTYLRKHKHWSPLDMANAVVEVECPRDIMRQLLRHWSLRPQEFSQRYADVTALGDCFVLREARKQDSKNRQNSIRFNLEDEEESFIYNDWNRRQQEILTLVEEHYRWGIEAGIAKECCRVILPEGNTMSRAYFNGTIRSWIHYLEVRIDEGVTQDEHVLVAKLIAEQINQVFKVTP